MRACLVADAARNNGEKTGKTMPPVEYQFKAGNPGRPKGARNKLGEDFIKALQEDFQAHGVSAVEEVRRDKPDQYLKVIASLMPKELTLNINDEYGEMTDDELIDRIRRLQQAITPFLAAGTGDAEGPTGTAASPLQLTKIH